MQRSPKKTSSVDVLGHLADSLDAKWRGYGKDVKRCRKKFSRKAVHDSRISTRRLLSTLELLEPFVTKSKLKKACKLLKEYLDGFDAVRDAHVQLGHVKQFKKFSAARPFKKWLKKQESRFARKTHKVVRKFDTKDLARRIAALGEEVRHCRESRTSAQAFAIVMRSVKGMFGRVAQLRRRIKPEDTNTIHCTRIAFKHFRYAVEELSPLLPEITHERCEQMHDYQSRMGDIQDAEIFSEAFDRFTCRKKVDHVAVVRFRSEIKRRQHKLIGIFLRDANQLNEFKL